MLIPLSSTSSGEDKDFLAVLRQIGQELSGFMVVYESPQGDSQYLIRSVLSRLVFAPPGLPIQGPDESPRSIVIEVMKPFVGSYDDIPAITTVAAVRAALRYKSLSAKTDTSLSAIARFDMNHGFIQIIHGAAQMNSEKGRLICVNTHFFPGLVQTFEFDHTVDL